MRIIQNIKKNLSVQRFRQSFTEWMQYAGAIMVGGAMVYAPSAFAEIPWIAPICKVANSLSGPVVTACATIAIVVAGIMYAMDEVSSMFKKAGGLIIGLGIAIGFTKFITWLGGDASACTTYGYSFYIPQHIISGVTTFLS